MPLESSTETENADVEANADAAANEDVNATGSSPGEDVSLTDAVNKALGEQEESSTSGEDGADKPASEQNASKDEAESGDKDKSKELPEEVTEEEIAKYSERAQQRIRQLVGVRNEKDAEIAEIRPKAEQMDRVTSYMEKHNITPEAFDNAMNVTRLLKSGDHESALKVVEPIYQELMQRAGRVLPDDLQERVRLGYLTQADAEELHRSKTRATNMESRQQEEQQRESEARERQQWENHCSDMQSHADAWAKTKASNDPDWHLKQEDLTKELELLLLRGGREGYPKTKEEAIALGEKALATVEARLKKFQPKPQPRTTPQGDHASSGSKSEPKTLMDAVNGALYG